MMNTIRTWITGVMVVAMLLSVAQTMIPEGSLRKITSMTGGLLLMFALLKPLLRFDFEELQFETESYVAAIQTRQLELETEQRKSLADSIAERTQAYILNKAVQLGISIQQVRVETELSDDELPFPSRVILDGARSEELSVWIAETLGIPAERQVWNGQESKN